MRGLERKLFIGGNWKSNGSMKSIESLFNDVLAKLSFKKQHLDVVICPMSIHLDYVKKLNTSDIQISAQNVSLTAEGAYTGEISAKALKDFGLKWTLVGHSERRSLYGESSKHVADKISIAQLEGLNTIACIGETKDQRTSGQTLNVIFEQLDAIKINKPKWENIVIAYEPVWAIGTGLTATPEQAQEVHSEIRKWVKKEVSETESNKIRIIYGGSVTKSNANVLITEKDIDGFLVGGASLKSDFIDIVSSHTSKFKH